MTSGPRRVKETKADSGTKVLAPLVLLIVEKTHIRTIGTMVRIRKNKLVSSGVREVNLRGGNHRKRN